MGQARFIFLIYLYLDNSIRVLLEAAIKGHGVVRLPQFAVEPYISHGVLQRVLSDFDPPGTPVYAVFTQGRIIPPRVHAFVTFLEKIHTTMA